MWAPPSNSRFALINESGPRDNGALEPQRTVAWACQRVITGKVSITLSLRRGRPLAGAPSEWTLADADVVVGSSAECTWRLDGTAPRHCQFGNRGGVWLVVDIGGGTALDGRSLDRPVAIAPGNLLTVGPCDLLVSDSGVVAFGNQSANSATGASADRLIAAAGLSRAHVSGADAEVLAAAGRLLQRLVAGLVAQMVDRARTKAELGADATMLSIGAANPLKALPADRALAALLTPTPGMMPPDQAVADAFADLEAHQAATLAGMQQALAATLERFSPGAIRARAQNGGLMSRVLPGAREAALWQAYEREFDGVAKGSSDAFVDLFADEFRRAFRTASSAPRRPS